jgi:hypothetical protein
VSTLITFFKSKLREPIDKANTLKQIIFAMLCLVVLAPMGLFVTGVNQAGILSGVVVFIVLLIAACCHKLDDFIACTRRDYFINAFKGVFQSIQTELKTYPYLFISAVTYLSMTVYFVYERINNTGNFIGLLNLHSLWLYFLSSVLFIVVIVRKSINEKYRKAFLMVITPLLVIPWFYLFDSAATSVKLVTGLQEGDTPSAYDISKVLHVLKISCALMWEYYVVAFAVGGYLLFRFKNIKGAPLSRFLGCIALYNFLLFSWFIHHAFEKQTITSFVSQAVYMFDMNPNLQCNNPLIQGERGLYFDGAKSTVLIRAELALDYGVTINDSTNKNKSDEYQFYKLACNLPISK